MLLEAAFLAAQLAGGAQVQAAAPMRPAPASSPAQAFKKTGGTPPVHKRRRRRTGMAIWRLFR